MFQATNVSLQTRSTSFDTKKTQSSDSGSKEKDKQCWFSKHEDKYQRELIDYYKILGSVYEKKLSTRILYPFLSNYYGQIVFEPLLGHNLQILCQEVCAFVCIPSQWMWPIFLFLYTACSLIARIMMLAPNWPNFLVSVCKIGQWNKSWPAGEIEFANFCLMLIIFNPSWWFFVIVFCKKIKEWLGCCPRLWYLIIILNAQNAA